MYDCYRVQCNEPSLSMDRKCLGGCWHCIDLCNTCMSHQATPGLTIAEEKDEITMLLKHCSQECLDMFSPVGLSLQTQVIQPSMCVGGGFPHFILKVSKIVNTINDVLTWLTIHLCHGDLLSGDKNVPFVLVRICTPESQHFLEFEITEDLELKRVPKYLQETCPQDIIEQLEKTKIVSQVLSSAFEKLGYSGLHAAVS